MTQLTECKNTRAVLLITARNVGLIRDDLHALFAEVDPKDTWALVGASVFASIALAESDPKEAHRMIVRW